MLLAVDPFIRSDYVATRFKVAVGRDIEGADRQAVKQYVAAIYLISHHNHELSHIGEMWRASSPSRSWDFIRLAAWAFLSAWTHTYGGLRSHLLVPGSSSLVDPVVPAPDGKVAVVTSRRLDTHTPEWKAGLNVERGSRCLTTQPP